MKNVVTTLAVLALCFTLGSATAQTKDEAAMQKAWEAYAAPGDMHKLLADETGTWNVDMTFWMDANAKPETSKSVSESKMILGGRYQEVTYKGNLMGMDWEAKNTIAYNNKSKEFTSTFIDNSGTGMMVAVGTYNPATKTITFKGEMTDPLTGKAVKYREIYTIVDANTRKLVAYDTKDGKEYKSMEIVLKRK